MEKINLVFGDYFNNVKSILWILSILSWLFFICTGLASFKTLSDCDYEFIWTIKKISCSCLKQKEGKKQYIYYPLQINDILIYIIFIITLVFALVGFVFYIYESTWKKDNSILEGMMGIWSRLHSFPLIIISFLFLLGEYFFPYYKDIFEENDFQKFYSHKQDIIIFGLSFSLIGLISLIFIYVITDLSTVQWYVEMSIKKGTYSCLIVLLWYYFIYTIYQLNASIYPDISHNIEKVWTKCYAIIFSIIFGCGSLIFSFFFKDLVVSFMNLLIYLGIVIYIFSIQKWKYNYYSSVIAERVIDIIMIVLSAVMITFLVIKYKNEIFHIN